MKWKPGGCTGEIASNSKPRSEPRPQKKSGRTTWCCLTGCCLTLSSSMVTLCRIGSSPSANFEDDPDTEHIGDMHYWQVWHALAPIENYKQQLPRFMTEF